MKNLRSEIIKYSKMLNSKKLSALRSGNISSRYKDGFLITPSGKKYSTLKNNDIVFVSLNGYFDKKKGIPSSEWKFHQDIYRSKKDAKDIPIEERNSEELSHVEGIDENNQIKKVLIYPTKSKAMNLAFDVTPAKYVTGLITERGITEASFDSLKKLFK